MVIRSISDIKRSDTPPSSSDDEEDKTTTSYVGGEKSGLSVKNPKKKTTGRKPLILTQYNNGLAINNETFLAKDDPRTQAFLDEIKAGVVPEELESYANLETRELALSMATADEDFDPAKHRKDKSTSLEITKPSPLFQGAGNTLSSTPSTAQNGPSSIPSVSVDESRPVTTIQIRYPNGQRVAQRFNEDTTVNDFICFASNALGGGTVQVLSGFPPTVLASSSLTLKEAALCNAAVTIRKT